MLIVILCAKGKRWDTILIICWGSLLAEEEEKGTYV